MDFLKVIELVPDMRYYFRNSEKLAKLYRAGRIYGGVIGVAGIIILTFFIYRLSKNIFWSLAVGILCLSSPRVIIYSKYLKPHFFASILTILNFIVCYSYYNNLKKEFYLISFFISGLMMGTIIQAVIVILLPLLIGFSLILERKISVKKSIKYTILGILILVIAALITNPYCIINLNEAIEEFKFITRWHHFSLNFITLYNYFRYQLFYGMGGFSLFIFLYSLIRGIYGGRKIGRFDFIFLIYLTISILILSGGTGAHSKSPHLIRASIFILPLFFAYIVEILRKDKYKSINRIILGGIIFFNLPYGYIVRTYYVNNVFHRKSTRIEAGKWINKNIDRNKSIGTDSDITPWTFPPIKILEYKIIIYAQLEEMIKDDKKPDYFIIKDWRVSDQNIKEFTKFYKIKKEFHNDLREILFYKYYGYFTSNRSFIICERKNRDENYIR